jgi:hypothetical protein
VSGDGPTREAAEASALLRDGLRYLDGDLGLEEGRRFEERLAQDPASARRFALLAMQRTQLVEMGMVWRGARRPGRAGRPGRLVLAGAGLLAAAAGVVVVTVGLGVLGDRRSAPRPELALEAPGVTPAPATRSMTVGAPPVDATVVGAIEALRGEVSLASDDRRRPAASAERLEARESLIVGPEPSQATLRLADGSRAVLQAAAALGPLASLPPFAPGEANGASLPLLRGRIFADLRAGVVLNTPLADVRAARPTARVAVDVRGESTRVEVHQGAARIVPFSSGKALDLEAGDLAVITPDREAQVERGPAPPPIVFTLQSDPRIVPVLRRMPKDLLRQLRGFAFDREGILHANQKGFNCSGEQRHSLPRVAVGAAQGNQRDIDGAFRVIDATMRFQAEDGSFLDSAVCDADWLGELAFVVAVLMESELERPYRARLLELLPRLGRTAHYLTQPAQVEALERSSEYLSKRYFVQSAAFSFTGLLLGDAQLEEAGRRFLDLGLGQQREDGAFITHGGTDSAYQGIILYHLAWSALRFPSPRADHALRRGGAWYLRQFDDRAALDVTENTRVGPRCRVSDCQTPEWQRIAWGLLYYGALVEPRATPLAERVFARRQTFTRP